MTTYEDYYTPSDIALQWLMKYYYVGNPRTQSYHWLAWPGLHVPNVIAQVRKKILGLRQDVR